MRKGGSTDDVVMFHTVMGWAPVGRDGTSYFLF